MSVTEHFVSLETVLEKKIKKWKNYKMKCERYLNKSAFRTFFYFK